MITKNLLEKLYNHGFSMTDIAKRLDVSIHKISYWMGKYKLKRRSIGEAIYKKHNKYGDPFKFKSPITDYENFLMGLGLGLFCGEGMKANKLGVRLGNTYPFLILYFRDFLENICGVSREKLKYSLQLFGDVSKQEAINFWCKFLTVESSRLGKISILKVRGVGTYKRKNRFGVLQIACHNKKLKAIFDRMIDVLKTRNLADVAQLVEHVHGRDTFLSAHLNGNVMVKPE